ncbi:MAG: WD40 repeat domain-containing protein, partial [Planctomycetota bacterium]
ILLALEAAERTDDATVRTALYEALAALEVEAVLHGPEQGNLLAQVHPHSTLVATYSREPYLHLADLQSNAYLRRLDGSGDEVLDVAFSRVDEHLAAAFDDGSIRVWEARSGRLILDASPAGRSATQLVFIADSRELLVGFADGGVARLDPRSGALEDGLRLVDSPIGRLALSDSGLHGMLRTIEETVFWRSSDGAETGRVVHLDGGHVIVRQPRYALPIPGREAFAIVNGWKPTGFSVVDVRGDTLFHIEDGIPRSVSPDGHHVDFTRDEFGVDSAPGVLDLRTGAIEMLEGLPIGTALLRTQGGRVVWTARDALLAVDPGASTARRTGAHRYSATSAVSVPGSSRFVTVSQDRTTRIWNPDLPTRPLKLPMELILSSVPLVTFEGRTLVFGRERSNGGDILVHEVESSVTARPGPELAELSGKLGFTSDGSKIVMVPRLHRRKDGRDSGAWVVEIADHSVRRIDWGSRTMQWGLDRGTGSLLAHIVDGGPRPLRRVDLSTGEVEALPVETSVPFCGTARSPTGDRLVLRVLHEESVILDASTMEVLLSFGNHGGDHLAYGFAHDGARLLTGSVDGTVSVMDTTTGDVLARHRGVAGLIVSVGFLGGDRLAFAQTSGAIRLFDSTNGALVAELAPTDGEFCPPIECADGQWLLTVTSTGWFQRFPLRPVEYARSVVPRDFEPEELDEFGIGNEEERRERILELARAVPSANRMLRAARLLDDRGELDFAIALMEEATKLDSHDFQNWTYHATLLCKAAARKHPGPTRDAQLDRALELLEVAVERRCKLERVRNDDSFALLRDRPG